MVALACRRSFSSERLIFYGDWHHGYFLLEEVMEDLEIRLSMLNPLVRARIKDLAITPGDDDLMLFIAMGDNTSAKIAAKSCTTVQSVSVRLARLRQKGYIVRQEVMQASGGYEYVYRNIYSCDGVKVGSDD
jgi:hypothetical protein